MSDPFTLARAQPLAGVDALHAAVSKLRPTPAHLTFAHAEFLKVRVPTMTFPGDSVLANPLSRTDGVHHHLPDHQLCLLARVHRTALPLLEEDITEIDPAVRPPAASMDRQPCAQLTGRRRLGTMVLCP